MENDLPIKSTGLNRRHLLKLAGALPLMSACADGRTRLRSKAKEPSMSAQADFDFFMGDWKVHHRRLVSRLTGSSEWQEFSGQSRAWKVMGGQGNVDDNVIDIPAGQYRALTLRSYDPGTGQWAIWWLDGRNPHNLDVPVKGSFRNGVGQFLADDTLGGKPIKVRFLWLDTQTGSPCWEQAFSADGGKTWETNWTMRFTRA